VEIMDKDNNVVRRFTAQSSAKDDTEATKAPAKKGRGGAQSDEIKATAGLNRFVWDLRYPRPEDFPGLVLWGGLTAPRAVPGKYIARFRAGKADQTVTIDVLPDPRSTATVKDMQAQFDLVADVGAKLTEVHRAIKKLRDVREQLQTVVKRLDPKKHGEAIKS